MARPQPQPRIRSADSDGAILSALPNFCSSSVKVSVRAFCLVPSFYTGFFTYMAPEEVPTRRLYLSAFTIGMGYLIGGAIPLLPYFFIPTAHIALIYSSILTGIVLLIFGAVKARVTGAASKGAGDYVWGAVSTLAVGGLGAAAAYGMVVLLEAKG